MKINRAYIYTIIIFLSFCQSSINGSETPQLLTNEEYHKTNIIIYFDDNYQPAEIWNEQNIHIYYNDGCYYVDLNYKITKRKVRSPHEPPVGDFARVVGIREGKERYLIKPTDIKKLVDFLELNLKSDMDLTQNVLAGGPWEITYKRDGKTATLKYFLTFEKGDPALPYYNAIKNVLRSNISSWPRKSNDPVFNWDE